MNWERIVKSIRKNLVVYVMLVSVMLLMILPFVWMVSNSLKSEAEISKLPPTLLPETPLWSNYTKALEKIDFYPSLANTVFITAFCLAGQIFSSSLAGFGFARLRFRGKDKLFIIMLATMMLPAQMTMIPLFIMFRSLGWVDTYLPLIIPAWLGAPFFIFMFRQFFSQIPEDLIEAARIDGASYWHIYSRLMLPLSSPVIAIVAIYTFLFTWNDFMGPLIYLNSPENKTIALSLAAFKGQYGVTDAQLLMAASCIAMVPCVVLFFAAQKYFINSFTSSGLKG